MVMARIRESLLWSRIIIITWWNGLILGTFHPRNCSTTPPSASSSNRSFHLFLSSLSFVLLSHSLFDCFWYLHFRIIRCTTTFLGFCFKPYLCSNFFLFFCYHSLKLECRSLNKVYLRQWQLSPFNRSICLYSFLALYCFQNSCLRDTYATHTQFRISRVRKALLKKELRRHMRPHTPSFVLIHVVFVSGLPPAALSFFSSIPHAIFPLTAAFLFYAILHFSFWSLLNAKVSWHADDVWAHRKTYQGTNNMLLPTIPPSSLRRVFSQRRLRSFIF